MGEKEKKNYSREWTVRNGFAPLDRHRDVFRREWIIENEGCTFELNSDPYDVNVKQLSVAIERIYEIIPRIWYAPVVASSAMI